MNMQKKDERKQTPQGKSAPNSPNMMQKGKEAEKKKMPFPAKKK